MVLLLEHYVHCVGGADVSCENLRAIVKDHESYAVASVGPVCHTGAIRIYRVGRCIRTIRRNSIQRVIDGTGDIPRAIESQQSLAIEGLGCIVDYHEPAECHGVVTLQGG